MEESTDIALARFTTLKVGGNARRLCQPTNVAELRKLVEELRKSGEQWFVLGGGSNLLVSSEGFPGTVIRMTQMINIENPEPGILVADAGARLPHLAKHAASLGLSGLEFAVGIPGTVGGGAVMNAGAHGSCIANVTESVTVLDTTSGDIKVWTHDEMKFVYRNSAIDPDKHVVVSSRYKLTPADADAIKAATQHNEEYRWRTQPLGFPNAGSTFKNPSAERSAGMLLDQAGAKELKEGNAAVSAIHANFVVNLGGATSYEVTTLLSKMQDTVYDKFEVRLHPEWKRLGKFSDAEREIWNGGK